MKCWNPAKVLKGIGNDSDREPYDSLRISVVELAFTAHQFLDAVLKDTPPHCCRPIVRVEALAISSPSLALVDESNIDQFVEVVMEIVGFDIDRGLEIGSTQFVVGDERAQDPKPGRMADRPLHREILLETQPALFGQRRLRLAHVLRWMAIGFGHLGMPQV